MADTKLSALPAVTTMAAADLLYADQSGVSKGVSASVLRSTFIGAGLSDASVAQVGGGGYSSESYLTGSSITIPVAGSWKASTIYQCGFDMVKTAAGTAAFTVAVKMGTLGNAGDPTILTLAYAVGTAAADTGWFQVNVTFRTIGSGTSAVIQGTAICWHHLAATGLITTGASGTGIIVGTSAGFNSTTQTIIGLTVNGGASFSGTNTMVQAFALNI